MTKTLSYSFNNLAKTIRITFAVISVLCSPFFSFAQNGSWQQTGASGLIFVTARSGAISFAIGTKGYISTGYDSTGHYRKDLWEFDTYSKSWTQKANFGGSARAGATGFSMDDKGYIGTGRDSNTCYNDFWQYNPVTNSWTQKANFGGGARSSATGFAVSGIPGGSKGYLGTGVDDNSALKNDLWEYNPATNVWAQKTNFPGGARAGAASFNEGTVGYIGTGYDIDRNYKSDFWMYSPSIDMWTQKANFSGSPRSGATAFNLNSVYGNRCYIIGGSAGSSNYFNDFWEYDANTNLWTQKANFSGGARREAISFVTSSPSFAYVGTGSGPTGYFNDLWQFDGLSWMQQPSFGGSIARWRAASFSIGSKGYVGTGRDTAGNPRKDFWEFDLAANTWNQLADFGGTARDVAVGFSIGNKGYIGTGSAFDNNFKNDFWEYDPANNTWTQKADFGGLGRMGATGFSIGNKGYIGTGTYRTQTLNDFWEFDPFTNTWTRKTNFAGPTRENATGFSIGDRGYVGLGGLNDFWEYDPQLDSWTQKAKFDGGARSFATGFGIGDKGYLGLGGFDDFWEFDPAMDNWTQKTDFPGGVRTAAIGFSSGGKGYIGFGNSSVGNSIEELKNDLWKYTPSNIVVPVVFMSLKAYEENSLIIIAWTVAEDHNTKEYQVEKSIDGIRFYIVGTKIAAGNVHKTSYRWTDKQAAGTVSYYRVKSVRTNGEIKISSTLMVSPKINDEISVYPNPIISGFVTVYISNRKKENYIVRLYNEQGQMTATYSILHPGGTTSENIYMPFSVLKSFYIIKIERENGQQKTFKLFFVR
jgi:N-acetylneuraminic acid mutarotase